MIALQGDGIRFDGFSCYRIADVRNLTHDPHSAFTEAAMKKLNEPIPRKPEMSVAGIEELLLSSGRKFPLITIHREGVRPDACWIGKVESSADGILFLWEIGPDAKWDRKLSSHKLSEITAVEFGGEYETALFAVGGDVPVIALTNKRKITAR
jgi:hypothetical protein